MPRPVARWGIRRPVAAGSGGDAGSVAGVSSRRGKRPGPKSRHLHAVPEPEGPPPPEESLESIAAAIDDAEPLALLGLASTMASMFDARVANPDADGPGGWPDATMFVDSLIGYDARETTALLHALAALLPDNQLAQRARREARRRAHHLPAWLTGLEDAEPGPAAASLDVLGDGENAIVSMRLVDGSPLTAVVYIDHNLGTVVKDAFLVPNDLKFFRAQFLSLVDDPESMSFVDLDPAEARSRIVQAIDAGTPTGLQTDTWPACRPLVEWIVGHLPSGGEFVRPQWSEAELDVLVEEFVRSPHAAPLADPQLSDIATDLVDFAAMFTGGDPLRWSMVNVEILLADWFPRTAHGGDRYLRQMPTVLRALIRFAHETRDIPPHLTELTLGAVDDWEPVYLEMIGELPGPSSVDFSEFDAHWAKYRRELALAAVGGAQSLAELDDTPLPDEPFSWDHIPKDIHPRVTTVLELLDRCAAEMFDVEMRTALRRVLARGAATEPAVFRRRSKDSTVAAAIAWAVASANDLLRPFAGFLTAKALLAHFGVSGSVSERANPFLRSFGAPEYQSSGDLVFGTPEVLTSQRRAEFIQLRDADA